MLSWKIIWNRFLLKDKPLIYTVGDSHCRYAWIKIPFVKTQTIGPMTMYSFGQDSPIVVKDIPKDAIVVFCFGEIDCRCHIYKHPPWPETIDKLASDYLAAVDHNAKIHPNIWLFNVLPPPRKAKVKENLDFPFLGSDEERLSFVKRLNDRLRESKYLFIDVYEKYSDKDGFLIPEKSDEHVHITDSEPLIDYIKTILDQK
ncbi:MAG: hypothetical protein PHT50_00405 [Candidatus Omnitrophica bacterium]|nr:hypothetical protein [Candidatus Omnitrophota bacterium]